MGRRTADAFSLVEVLVVVLVLGLLAGIAVPVYLSQRARAADASVKADLRNVATAVTAWTVDHSQDPDGPAGPGSPISNFESGTLDSSLLFEPGLSVPTSPGNFVEVFAHADGQGFCVAGASMSGKRPWRPPGRPGVASVQIFDSTMGGITETPSIGCAYGSRQVIAAGAVGTGAFPCPQITRVRVQWESGASWRIVLDLSAPLPAGASLYHAYFQNGAWDPFANNYATLKPGTYTRHFSAMPGWTRTLGFQFRAADGRSSVGCTQGMTLVVPDTHIAFDPDVVTVPPTP